MRARRSRDCSPAFNVVAVLAMLSSACGPSPKRVEAAEVNFRVAKQFYAKNDLVQAMSNAMKARDEDPKNPEVHNFLGLIHLQRNELELSEKSFSRAVELDPKYSEAQNHLCLVLSERGEQDRAIAHCQKAVENILYATPERAYHNMGLAYERKGDTPKAVEAYQKALGYNKRFVMSLKALGEIQAKKGRYADALRPLEDGAKVCKESPKGIWLDECPETFYQLALSYIQLRRKDRAIASLEDCVEYSKNPSELMTKCQFGLKQYK